MCHGRRISERERDRERQNEKKPEHTLRHHMAHGYSTLRILTHRPGGLHPHRLFPAAQGRSRIRQGTRAKSVRSFNGKSPFLGSKGNPGFWTGSCDLVVWMRNEEVRKPDAGKEEH